MERQRFEEQWKIAFLETEKEPSGTVWTNIELQLERDSGGAMKRRLLMFQLLAAASMVFAMGIGSFYYISTGNNNTETSVASAADSNNSDNSSSALSTTPGKSKEQLAESNFSIKEQATEESSGYDRTAGNLSARKKVKGSGELNESRDGNITTETIAVAKANTDASHEMASARLNFSEREMPILYSYQTPTLNFEQKYADPGEALLARLEAEERKYREEDSKKKSKTDEGLWTSVGFSAGTYDPNATTSSSRSVASFSSATASGTNNPSTGSAYSVGLSVGGKLNNRLVVQGGLVYLTQNADYTSNAVSGDKVALNEFSLTGDRMSASAPYEVNSNMTYLSVPVQAGYILLDRAFAIQVNGGVATDFFMRNKLSSDNSQFSDVSAGPGSDSPYRSINFSGLVGTEFSYRFSDHYRISVNPGFRYALNSIYKSEVPASNSPVTFDVGLRFRYIFSR